MNEEKCMSLFRVDHNKLENSERDGNTRPPYLPPEKPVCRSKSRDLEHGTKLWKKYIKAVCCHRAIYHVCRVHHAKGWAGWIISWNQDFQDKYQQPHICRCHHPNSRKWRGTKEPLNEGEKGEWKSCLKTQRSENRSWHPVPSLHGK